MQKTIFNTPLLTPLLRLLAIVILKLIRWRVIGQLPAKHRFVMIAGPHTSNWDFLLTVLAAFREGFSLHWMGKDSLFPKPFAGFVRWMGGVAIDRSQANDTVAQMVEQYRRRDELIVMVPPEGTRSAVKKWKTGFYHIANGAGVPILPASIDCNVREIELGPLFHPTGDVDADIAELQGFYKGKRGIND